MDTLGAELLRTPFKDYAIIAIDGREVHLHKCVFYIKSKYFRVHLDGEPYNSYIYTNFEYDDLLIVVHWMY